MHTHHSSHKNTLSAHIQQEIGVNSAHCYQCGKCSAGCPLANDMDYTSSMVMRLLQTEEAANDKDLLQSQSIWMCASCEMCISRCPMSIDIPKVMDFLRQKSLKDGLANKQASKNIIPFHRSFLDMIRLTGRSYEIGLVADYKLRTWNIFQDLLLAPKMFVRGKLAILPEMIKGKNNVSRIFNKTQRHK